MNSPFRIAPWIACVAMALTSLAAWKFTPRDFLADELPPLKLEEVFPKKFGNWRQIEGGSVVIANPQQEEIIQTIYTDVISRNYVNDKGQVVMLSVAYGRNQADGKSLHYPEVCYPSQGFSMLESHVTMLDIAGRSIKAKQILTSQGPRVEPVTYWATVGEKAILGSASHKAAQISYGLRGLIPDGMLVRASTIGADAAEQYKLQQQFLDALVRAAPDAYRSRIAGT